MIGAAISAPPTLQPYNEDGTYTVLAEEYPFVAVDLTNPLNYINEQHNEVNANVVLANAALIYNPIKELTIKISGGIENRDDREENYTTRNFINSDGSAGISTEQFTSYLSDNNISYVRTLTKHIISPRSEEHTSDLKSLMRSAYTVYRLINTTTSTNTLL